MGSDHPGNLREAFARTTCLRALGPNPSVYYNNDGLGHLVLQLDRRTIQWHQPPVSVHAD